MRNFNGWYYVKGPDHNPYTATHRRGLEAIDQGVKKFAESKFLKYSKWTKRGIWMQMKKDGFKLMEIFEVECT